MTWILSAIMPTAEISDDTKIETTWGILRERAEHIAQRDRRIAQLVLDNSALATALEAGERREVSLRNEIESIRGGQVYAEGRAQRAEADNKKMREALTVIRDGDEAAWLIASQTLASLVAQPDSQAPKMGAVTEPGRG